MDIMADVLYKALKSVGTIPKTFEVQDLTISTDTATGKSKKKSAVYKYAPVELVLDEKSITVDLNTLKKFAQKAKRNEVGLSCNGVLTVRYESCEMWLENLHATPGATVDLDELVCGV